MPMCHFKRPKDKGKNLWILKPVGLNRGQGIHVVDSVKKCRKLIREYCAGKEYVNGKPVESLNQNDKSFEKSDFNKTYNALRI